MQFSVFKKAINYLLFFFIVIFAFLLFGCKEKNDYKIAEVEPTTNIDYDILMYSSKLSVEEFEPLLEKYKEYSGKIVKIIKGNENDLEYHMNLSNPPDVFSVTNFDELEKQKNLGNVFDFINASNQLFKEIIEKIPDKLKLKINNISNCGIPLKCEGFGLIINTKTFSEVFGENSYKNIINDLKKCSFNEFVNFSKEIKICMNKREINNITIGENTYEISDLKKGIHSLSCIFSMPCQTDFITMMNPAFALKFDFPFEIREAKNLNSCSNTLKSFCESLDFVSQNTISGRGKFLVDNEINSESQALNQFLSKKSLFYIGNDNIYEKIKILEPELSKYLMFIPYKIFMNKGEPTNNKKSESCITISCPIYLSINSKSKNLNLSQDFLAWLKTSPIAQIFLNDKLGFLQYDTKDTNFIRNSLSVSTLDYLNSENYLNNISLAMPNELKTSIDNQIKMYLETPKWENFLPEKFVIFCKKKFTNN